MSEEPMGADATQADLALPDAVESALLGHRVVLGREELTREAQVSMFTARKFWHALGFPLAQDEESMFTEADLGALREVSRLIREEGVSEDLALSTTRAFGRTADRLAVWQTQLVSESLAQTERATGATSAPAAGGLEAGTLPDLFVARAAAARLVELADDLEPLLVYAWRRHLTGAIVRMLADAGESADNLSSAPPRVVGFADLVSFTSLVSRMSEQQLAALVQRFEMLASDVVTTHGGRVIKTVGDEVLFAHTDAAPGAAIALDLVAAIAEDDILPPVRVGMAQGRVVSRLGDVFGTTVNKASRLTAVAPPGTVYVDDVLAKMLGSVSGFTMTELRRRHLRGIGMVTPSELRRATGERRPVAPPGHP